MADKHVIVVGAGMGGLACAIDLASSGCQVTVIERAQRAGGKVRAIEIEKEWIDSGPTVFTMKWVFDALFSDADLSFDNYVRVRPLSVLARHAWSGDQTLDLYADLERSIAAIGDFSGAQDAGQFEAFCRDAQRTYKLLRDTFLTASRPNPISLAARIGFHRPLDLFALRPFTTMSQCLSKQFQDPRLRQLLGRYATYVGSSPYLAPATLSVIAHVEQDGVWTIDGGMRQLPEALHRAAASLGATFRFSSHVQEIAVEKGRVSGVILSTGEHLAADAVVVNGDVSAVGSGLFGTDVSCAVKAVPTKDRSLSAVTWSVRAVATGFPLVRHNVFFGADYQTEFDDLFKRRTLPSAPTVYVCAHDRDELAPPEAHIERLLILANAPANGDSVSHDPAALQAYEGRVFELLARCGLILEQTAPGAVVTDPVEFNRLFPGTGGGLYGAASHGWQASFRRATSTHKVAGLYMAGGSTHPGPGVPMASLSGRLAAERLLTDLRLIQR